MGKIAELYQAQKQSCNQYETGPVPNMAAQQAEYLEYQKNKRMEMRKLDFLRHQIVSQTFDLDQVLDVYEKAGGRQERERKRKEFENTGFYRNYWKKLREEQPAVFAGVSEEEMNALEKDDQAKRSFVKNLVVEGKIDVKAYQEAAGHALIAAYDDFSIDPEIDQRVVEGLEQLLSEEQQKALVDQVEAYQDPINLPDAERVSYPYAELTGELLRQMPPEISGNHEKRAQYEHVLKFAGSHLTAPNETLRKEGLQVDKDIQAIEAAVDRHVRDVVRPAYQNGKYDGIFQKNEGFREFRSVAEEKRETFEEMRKEGIQLSDKTKEGIRLMTRKMEEMGLEKFPHAANGEDGNKTYGFVKLLTTKKALTDALNEGDPEKILAAGQEYEKTYRDTEELYRISREYFNQEPGIFPGNMDSIRNRAIPYAFTSDVQNTAFINSVYQTYLNVKENGMDLEEYLNNPAGSNLKDAEKKWEAKSFAKVSEQVETVENAIDLMTSVADYDDVGQELINVVPQYGFGRQLNMPNMLEGDKEFREKNGIVAYTMAEDMFNGAVLNSEQGKFLFFHEPAKTPMEEKAKIDTLRNLMLVSDEDRKLNGIFAGLPETDYLGRKLGEGFDAQKFIAKTPVDYEGMIDRAKRIQKRAGKVYDAFGDSKWLNEKKALEATRQLYTEVLLAHPEDMEKEGFKKMRQELDRTYDRIQEMDEAELGDLARENKAVMQDMLDENRRQYLIENEPVQELRRLEAQAVKTGDFSKYAAFMVDVAARENDIRPEVYEQYSAYQDEILAKDETGNFVKGMDFYRNLCHAVNEIDIESSVSHSMKSEELAAKIRSGEIPVDPAFENVKSDYHSSRILANQILAGGEDDRRIQGTGALCYLLDDVSPKNKSGETVFMRDKEKQQLEFYENGKIAESAAQRRRYLNDAQSGYTVKLGDVREDGSIEPPKPENISERLQKSCDRAINYNDSIVQLKQAAQNKLDEMNTEGLGGRNGSDQYKAMYDSLEAVTKLNAGNTPAEVEQAVENVRLSAAKYRDKIDAQLFAKIRQKGKNRYNFADGLEKFAKDSILSLSEQSTGNLALNERISDQISHAASNLAEYQEKQARPEGLVVDEKLLGDIDRAVENLKETQADREKKYQEKQARPEGLVVDEKLLGDIDRTVENLKETQADRPAVDANLMDNIENAVEKLSKQIDQKEAAFLKKAQDAEKALNAMGPGLYKPDGSLWEEKMQAFVNVATAKEIERRGGLAAGETHHTVSKELFGKQEQRAVLFDMLKKNDGATLSQMAASPDLKQKLEQQMNVKKSKKQEGIGPEEQKETIKRSNTISFGPK